MAVARMKKVTVIGYREEREQVVSLLQSLGTMQIVDFKEAIGASESEPLSRGGDEPHETDAALQEVVFSINFLDRFRSKEKSLIDSFTGAKVAIPVDEFRRATTSFDYHAFYRRCVDAEAKLSDIKNQRSRIQALKESLAPWSSLEIPLEQLDETEAVDIAPMSASLKDLARVEAAVEEIGGRAEIMKVSTDVRQAYFVLFTLKEDREALGAIRSLGVNRVAFGDLTGSAAVNLAQAESDLVRLDTEDKDLKSEIDALEAEYNLLLALHDDFAASKSVGTVQTKLGFTDQAFAIQGWVKASQTEILAAALQRTSDALEIQVEDPADSDMPPTSLENGKWAEPFEIVTGIYGLPGYNEADPTPFLAPFFFVFFGIALSDAAYGIMLALMSLYFIKKLDIPWAHKKLFRLMIYAGISTVVFGALMGSWFGDLISYLPPQLGFLKSLRDSVTVLDPIQDPLKLLVISLAMGAVQIWYGLYVKMQATIKQSGVVAGLLDQGSWLFLLGSLMFVALSGGGIVPKSLMPVAANMAKAGAVFVVAAQGRSAKSWFAKPFLGLYGLYTIVAYFSDMLSYSRLLALGLATAVIGNVVNQMAQLVSPIPLLGPVFVLAVLVVGHAFNFFINILGSFIHAGRLQFVEFFTKFFEGGGKAFRPFGRDNKYTVVKG